MKYDIVRGNIIDIVTDAVVLPANEKLREGSGASTAIFEAAGRKQLTEACSQIGFCKVGSAVVTMGYQLDAKYIIHAVVPKWIDGNNGEYELLGAAYYSALSIADVLQCETISFPLLASGNNGFDARIALEIAKASIDSFSGTYLRKVVLVIYGNYITKLVKESGDYPIQIRMHGEKNSKTKNDVINAGKQFGKNMLDIQIRNAKKWLGQEENQEKLMKLGGAVALKVLAKMKL